jgi:hypothetical protein
VIGKEEYAGRPCFVPKKNIFKDMLKTGEVSLASDLRRRFANERDEASGLELEPYVLIYIPFLVMKFFNQRPALFRAGLRRES